MEHARVIGNHICWQEKCSFELYQMFRTRYELFKVVYSHKAGKSIEYMICDILKYANDALNITSKINDTQKYLSLDDSILQRIQFAEIQDGQKGMEELKKSKQLIERLHKRELYKCCGYLLLTPEIVAVHNPSSPNSKIADDAKEDHPKISYHKIEQVWAAELFQMFQERMKENDDKENVDDREELQCDDLRMQLMSLSFGKETEHPMNRAIWYSSKNPNVCKQFHVEQISTLSGAFREVVVRAYVKKTEWKSECEAVFQEFAKEKGLIQESEGDNVYSSMVVSPPQKKKSKSRQQDDADYADDDDDVVLVMSHQNENESASVRVRKRRRPSSSVRSNQSVDLMDVPQRNKKPRLK